MSWNFLSSEVGKQRGLLVLAIFYYLLLGYVIYVIIPEYSHVCTYRDILGVMALSLFILSFVKRFKWLMRKSLLLFFAFSLAWVLHVVSETSLSVESGLLVLVFLIIVSLGIAQRRVFQWYITVFSLALLYVVFTINDPVIPGLLFYGLYSVTAFINYLLISNFQKMQSELKTSVSNLRLLLNQVDECFILLDSDLKIQKFNKMAFETIHKYQNKELVKGASFDQYFQNDGDNQFFESLKSTHKNSIRFDHKSTYTVDGVEVTKWYDIKFFPVHTENSDLDKIVFTALDITDRYESSEKLIRSGKMFKILFRKAPIGMAFSDMQGKVIEANDAYCDTVGYPIEEVVDRTFSHYTHSDDLEKNYDLLERLLKKEINEYQLEKRYIQKNGRLIYVIVRVILLNDMDGKDRLLAQVIDITRLKKVEEILKNKNRELSLGNQSLERSNLELERKNMELDRFIYSASHDLRAPLSSLLGLINISKMEQGEEYNKYLDLMEKSVNRLDNFIGEIIQFSANESTDINMDLINNISRVIEESYESLMFSKEAEKVSLRIKSNVTHSFRIDRQRLDIILSNLLSNAIKYHDPQKEERSIVVESSINNNILHLEIRDNGIGIPDGRQERIFDFFYRAHEHSNGAGLGLYIVKQAIMKLNGSINLHSKAGIGTNFTIELPIQLEFDHKIVA